MSDLIKREDAIKALDNWCYKDDIEAEIRAVPSIEPKRGEWIELDELDGGYWKCSACGTTTEAYSAFKIYAYCPFCGARMEDVKHLPHIKRLKGGASDGN